jgi:hypothetical protein
MGARALSLVGYYGSIVQNLSKKLSMCNRVGKSNHPGYEKEIGAVHVAITGLALMALSRYSFQLYMLAIVSMPT